MAHCGSQEVLIVGGVGCRYTVKPVLSDHIKQDIFLAFQTDGCFLL